MSEAPECSGRGMTKSVTGLSRTYADRIMISLEPHRADRRVLAQVPSVMRSAQHVYGLGG
jgi:hypothetical protein